MCSRQILLEYTDRLLMTSRDGEMSSGLRIRIRLHSITDLSQPS